uniref:ArsR family transcriptional regulator n=1 Tax=candidate division WOR-3 bacterium TaxID=2052148 RepID=A0A7V3ZTZ6_UNCW3
MRNYANINFENCAYCLKALGLAIRLKILWLLKKSEKALCVCELAKLLNKSHYNISRNLKELKMIGLIKERREGKYVFYSLAKEKNNFLKYLFKIMEIR